MKNLRAAARGAGRRGLAVLAAAGTLWAAAVTAGSDTLVSAAAALRSAAPLTVLRWELGDLWGRDTLSPAAVLALGESPLLLSARQAVSELWSREAPEETAPAASSGESQAPDAAASPVTETPLQAQTAETDNGVPARTLVPTDPSGYTVCGPVYISNSTRHTLEIGEVEKRFAAALTEEAPQILILHTHGSEAYTPPAGTEVAWSGSHRTTDTRYNVVHVGDVMAQAFADAGISVLHDRTLYDYPSYDGSYDRSLQAIRTDLQAYPSLHFILDVHRDAIEDAQGNEYKVVCPIQGQGTAAQMTLVVGSDGSGLYHPWWMENLRLAAAVQKDLLRLWPTLMRPVLLRNSRYNQHATTGSLLVEVGAAGNSPEEAALAGKLFAQRMAQVLQDAVK
jgi:stage II sporulation protein P